jgi:1L-myo-inositol 1-phosphate cytidylyltransferase / CDP-L-myo-inositol myo-inositolphosphotransferase
MGSEKSAEVIAFASALEADRRVAGVAAAARAVRELAQSGVSDIRLKLGGGPPLAPATLADIERLRGACAVRIECDAEATATAPSVSSWDIVRRTAKPSDGLVSRWLNRPISQRVTWLVLAIPAARPIHVTIFNALLAVLMAVALLTGGQAGLLLGGILFHSASVLDGVDGEMARATFRTTPSGAALDSAIDMATNLLFIGAVSAHLGWRDGDAIGWIGGWALLVGILGSLLIARRVRAEGATLSFDMFKRSGPVRGLADGIYWIVQTLSSRDCFAFLFMVLIILGLERVALSILSGVATIWFLYVLASLAPVPRAFRRAA